MRHLPGCIILFLVVLMWVGCSSDGFPTNPNQENEIVDTAAVNGSSHNLRGLFTFVCDPDAQSVEVIPIRGAELHLNALKFLEPPAFVLLTLEGPVKVEGNILDVNIGLRNPYPGSAEYTGFDVCGIMFSHGSEIAFNDPSLIMAGEGETRLLNADGFTRWWNPSEFPHGDKITNYINGMLGTPAGETDFNCIYNGYKYYADDLEKDDPLTMLDPSNRGLFTAGKMNVRHYTIDMSGGLVFNYAVDACWKRPLGSAPYTVPDDFPPAANREEAYYVEMTDVVNTLYHVDQTYLIGGDLSVRVDVWDHFNAGLNEVYAYSPSGLPLAEALSPMGGSADYSSYELDFTGENLSHNGEAELYIAVRSNATGYGGALPGVPVCAVFKRTFDISPDAPPGWALTWGGDDSDLAFDVALDDSGNIYVCGYFQETVDFDPGPGVCEKTATGVISTFISKFNSNAVFQWVRVLQGNDHVICNEIESDTSNCIYITGYFRGTADFDPGGGVDTHMSSGERDIYLCKLDDDGLFQWAHTWGGIECDEGYGLEVDSLNNIYVAGVFNNEVDFDPGPGIDIKGELGETDGNAFISKFSPNGDYIYARTWGDNPLIEDYAGVNAISVDGDDDVYVIGSFSHTVDFDPSGGVCEYTSNGSYDVFISKFDKSGAFEWAYTWGADKSDYGHDIACDGMSAVYVIGPFNGTVDFDPGPGVDEHTEGTNEKVYVCKYLPDGTYQWTIMPEWYEEGSGVVVDHNHNVFTHDMMYGSYAKYDQDGVFQWWFSNGAYGAKSCIGEDNASYTAGTYSGTNTDFKPGDGVEIHSSNGKRDAFLMKLTTDGTWE